MEIIIIILFSLSILFFILSFLAKDKSKQFENHFENFSITLMQEIYQLKKKVKILEEEILVSDEPFLNKAADNSTASLMDEVVSYYEQGYSIQKITEFTSLSENDVYTLLEKFNRQKDGYI